MTIKPTIDLHLLPPQTRLEALRPILAANRLRIVCRPINGRNINVIEPDSARRTRHG